MKKRLGALGLALCMALCLLGTTRAAAVSEHTALETIRVLGIMNGDERGNMNLSSAVTRAEFVTMMTAASPYKNTVGGYGVSLFKDVKQDHWASEYIKLAIEQGWVSGYVDGTFRPDNQITLEEACAALLRLLGYDASSLAGSFPTAQLSKAKAIGLMDDMTAVQGQRLKRQDCVTLFYNLLVTQNHSGVVHGTTLGYTITNGEVNYSTLVHAETKGPYIAPSGGGVLLPFAATGITVYRDGAISSLTAIKQYDVYYYNENLRTVWVYTGRATGTLTAVSPSQTAPTSATVAGTAYSIGTSTAAYQFSSQGGFSTGDVVTLLLGMNGEIVDVISAQDSNAVYYGVVVSSETGASSASTGASGAAGVQTVTSVVCTDAVVRTFYHTGSALSAGRLVTVTANDSGATLRTMQTSRLSGTVSKDASSFAGYAFAAGVEILDTNEDGGYARIYPTRLAGVTLDGDDVQYYTLDSSGSIDRLVLNDVTGDTYSYAYLTNVVKNSQELSVSASYQLVLNGATQTLNSSVIYSVDKGGARISWKNGQLNSLRQLESVKLTELGSLSATAGSRKFQLDEAVQVLLRDSTSQTSYPTTLSEINTSEYTLTGWYDDFGHSAGGRIRILVATPISN